LLHLKDDLMKGSHSKDVASAVLGGLIGLSGNLIKADRKMEPATGQNGDAEVFLIKTGDRSLGIRSLLSRFDLDDYRGKSVALKANFNSADPFPASTHIDTLEVLIKALKEAGVGNLTMAERSGMGRTRDVLQRMGVFNLAEKISFNVAVLDDVEKDGWTKIELDGTHWLKGFYIANHFLIADKIVQTCCLKTHRFGGHFTISLKNSIGLVAKRVPGVLYDYMAELHTSPNQRLMIAEVNRCYNVDLVLMDAIKAFISGGPDRGVMVEPNLLLASKERVAIDAVGVAILRLYGATGEVAKGRIFGLEQIRRAAELGVGVGSASNIRLVPLNDESVDIANKIGDVLKNQG